MERRPWTKDELLQVLKLYCLTPFGRIHSRNPQVQQIASQLGRTPLAVALKMTNFASLDPTLKQSGMTNSSRLDREVWTEFFVDMTAALAVREFELGRSFAEEAERYELGPELLPEDLDVLGIVKMRRNQDFFRRLVLASYENKCALTGIDESSLLVASHIVPWADNKDIRIAPQNGICLNALHDRAFDHGLITFDDDYHVVYSKRLPEVARAALASFGSQKLRLPSRFVPDRALITHHRKHTFRGR